MNEVQTRDLPAFDRSFFNTELTLTRIGNGALGGKASGLVLIHDTILPKLELDPETGFDVNIPTFTVLTTEVFDKFLIRNKVYELGRSDIPDDRLAHAFQKAELPAEIVGDLRALISHVHTPLAVRSSSLLEDALDHPFAGVYATKMIPNNEIEEDARYRRLVEAIKLIYASVFFRDSKAYLASIGREIEDEKMAVIIQEVVGHRHNQRFFPSISGVARSYNYYPSGHARSEDGVANLALGLGRSIVDGGKSWTFCPEYPRAPPPFNNIGDLLKNTQTTFWAVNMGKPPLPDPLTETECLVRATLEDAEEAGVLKYLVSTYDPASDRMNPGLGGRGARALTFAPILGSHFLNFNDVLKKLIQTSKDVLGVDVEIEFAVDPDPENFLPARIGFLQVRPMAVGESSVVVHDEELHSPRAVVSSENVLGNGVYTGIRDILFIKPESFDTQETLTIAREIDQLNETLVREGRPYVLIGFGRWGTSDRYYGVPITWPQISGAKVIVESTLEGMAPDMSQGSHFFHNVISFRILYFSISHDRTQAINWSWLNSQETVTETTYLKHVRCCTDLDIRVDGSTRRGVIQTDG